jgi:drug/metabolite transporter (DMT)-like permease
MRNDDERRAGRRGRRFIEAAFALLGAVLVLAGALNRDDEEAIQIYLLAVLAWVAWSLALLERRRQSSGPPAAVGAVLATAVVIAVLAEEKTIANDYTPAGTARVAALGAVLLASGWLARRSG